MAKVLLTGCDGFAGHYVAQALSHAGHDVVGFSKSVAARPNPWLSSTRIVDLADQGAVQASVADVRPQQAVHLAAISFVAHGDAEEIYRNNIVGTRNLLDALGRLDNFDGPALIVSSGNVYGSEAQGKLSEDAPALPANDYGLSKLACEHLARMYRNAVPSVVLRPFNYTGVGQTNRFIIPKIVEHVRLKRPEIGLGNTDVSRDFSDVRFFAQACLGLLQNPAAVGEIVNICSGHAHSLAEILEMAQRLSGHSLAIKTLPELVRPNEVKQLWGDPAKLFRLVGPIDCPPLEETLRWMLDSPAAD